MVFGQSQCTVPVGQSEQTVLVGRRDFVESDRCARLHAAQRKRSGYYGNLGSLKAGTRHHGDYSVMGNSFPPTFPEDLLAHASQ